MLGVVGSALGVRELVFAASMGHNASGGCERERDHEDVAEEREEPEEREDDEQVDIGGLFCGFSKAQAGDRLCGGLVDDARLGEGAKGPGGGVDRLVEVAVKDDGAVAETNGQIGQCR